MVYAYVLTYDLANKRRPRLNAAHGVAKLINVALE